MLRKVFGLLLGIIGVGIALIGVNALKSEGFSATTTIAVGLFILIGGVLLFLRSNIKEIVEDIITNLRF